ncbi:MAG: DUF1552 domain-containing protein [Kofleriaceae bacterium]
MNSNRRKFLQYTGLGAGSLLLPSLLWKKGVKAGPVPGAPPRIVFCFAEHGVVRERWQMPRGNPDSGRWSYDLSAVPNAEFSEALAPLAPFKDNLTVIDGLSIATGIGDPYGDGHAKGWNAALTGAIARETIEDVKSNASKPSLDQVIGKALRAQDPLLTDLVTQEFGIYQYNFHALLFGEPSPGTPVVRLPHLEQPREAYNRMFPNGDGTAPPDPVRVAQPDVLAQVSGMYDRIQGRLSTEDRRKLEQHRDLVRDMEARLRRLAGLSCGQPPAIRDWYWGQVPHWQRWQDHTKSFWDLTTVALSCGMSRVVTMQWGQVPVEECGGTGDLHEAYAHRSDPSHSTDPNYELAKTVMTNYTKHYYGFVAQLASTLRDVVEDNGTLLDNTMIVILSDIANGNHDHEPWPVVIVGGKNHLNTGRYHHMEKETLTTTTASWVNDNTTIGYPHNHVLVALQNAMGVGTNFVGQPSIQPKKQSAPPIDLTGPLPDLLR